MLSFSLEELETILYRESSLIAEVDVPRLLRVLLDDRGLPVPKRIEDDCRASDESEQ